MRRYRIHYGDGVAVAAEGGCYGVHGGGGGEHALRLVRVVHGVEGIGEGKIPILTTSTPISSMQASICLTTNSEGVWWMAATPRVFWAVKAVVAVMA